MRRLLHTVAPCFLALALASTTGAQSLTADESSVDTVQGGTQNFHLDSGAGGAGHFYIVLGSMSVILSMMGNFTSIAFPESRPVSSLTSSASPTGTLMMIGCLLLGVTCAGVVVFGAGLLGMPALQPVFALVIFIAIVGAYRLTLSPAARTFSERRDDVFRALGSG